VKKEEGPPAPDTSRQLAPFGQETVEAVYSPSKAYRAAITRDARGIFRVHLERWDVDGWPEEPPHWCPYNRGATFVDTLEHARTLARERLALAEPPGLEGGDVER
jgi:hypothetical protein